MRSFRRFTPGSSTSKSCLTSSSFTFTALRTFFVQCTATPNEECMKFFADGHRFLEPGYGTVTFDRFNQHQSPLASTLISGNHDVVEVTVGEAFVTVRRREEDETDHILQELREAGHYVAGDGNQDGADTGAAKREGDFNAAQHAANQQEFKEWVEKDLNKASATVHREEGAVSDSTGVEGKEGTYEPPRVGEAEVVVPPPAPWDELQYTVSALLTDHLFSGMPHLTPDAPHPHPDTLITDDDSEVVAMIKELVASTIRPQLQDDGGDIRFVEFREADGTMWVELLGACKKCKSSGTTLRNLIERTTKHWIPEVVEVMEWKAGKSNESSPTSKVV